MVSKSAVARVVILGASNVARGIGTIVDEARAKFGSPLEIMAAMGHGRSYGLTTSAVFRTLPGILDCGLWAELESRPPLPTWTIMTDVGNDIIYGCTVEQILGWINECAARMRPRSENLLLTGLPMESVSRISPFKFLALRNSLFPKSTMQLDDGLQSARQIDAALHDLAREHAARLLPPEPRWYGLDPIHIRFAIQREAWRMIFGALTEGTIHSLAENIFSVSSARRSWREWWRVVTIRPQRSVVRRRAREVAQPAVVLRDGSTLSFF